MTDTPAMTPIMIEDELQQWLQSPLGQVLLAREREALAPVLSRVFGYHALQISCAPSVDMLQDCLVCHKIRFASSWTPDTQLPVADLENLPLETDSMDVVLIHHALDYTGDCHRMLREATRVLRPGGRLMIVGFNPLSMWYARSLLSWRPQVPWNARFIARRRLTDWLSLLDFHVEAIRYGGYLPPTRHPRVLARASRIEQCFDWPGNPTGAFYLVTASKQRVPLIPVSQRWRKVRAPMLGVPLGEAGRVASSAGAKLQRGRRVVPFKSVTKRD